MKLLRVYAGIAFLVIAGPAFGAGAIAVDHERGVAARDVGYGLGWGRNYEEARRDAMRECRNAGNRNCRVAVWFERCGAYAAARTQTGIGYGRSQGIAERMALRNCPNCQIVVSVCE